jgi:hypothetical protein
MSHETVYLRAPSVAAAKTDLKAALQDAGIDPYESVFYVDDEGNDQLNPAIIAVHPAGAWTKDNGDVGDHCLINGRIDDERLLSVVKSFEATDPSLAPSEVPDEDKAPNGTSRINAPNTPLRPVATTE